MTSSMTECPECGIPFRICKNCHGYGQVTSYDLSKVEDVDYSGKTDLKDVKPNYPTTQKTCPICNGYGRVRHETKDNCLEAIKASIKALVESVMRNARQNKTD